MLRAILWLHRWTGIVVGLVMTLWCLSGFVMMYSDYPRLLPQEQLRGLAPLAIPDRAAWARVGLKPDLPLAAARIERMAGGSVLRIVPTDTQTGATPATIDLATGGPIARVDAATALAIGQSFGARFGIAGAPLAAVPSALDQWNVPSFRRHQPLHRIDYPEGETVYVAASGEVVQQTTRAERFWGWLGAVPHWLYPTLLRQDGARWAQVVIWTAVAGCFLTVTGLWVGVARLRRRRRDGRIGSPYRGLWWWHHIAGLCFGLLTLSWAASGLFTMNPWGFLDSDAAVEARARLAGPMRWGEVADAFAAVGRLPADTVRLEAAPLGGRLHIAAITGDGRVTRFDAAGRPAPLTRQKLTAALGNGPAVASLELLTQEDAYHYRHKQPPVLPVWRAVLADADRTRLYIDPATGRLLHAADRNGRAERWLRNGLHSLDLPGLRRRPVWDLVVVPLLALVTLVCATGSWMGIRRVRTDVRRLRRRRRRARCRASGNQRRTPRALAGPG